MNLQQNWNKIACPSVLTGVSSLHSGTEHGGAENAGQDIAGQDNDGQEKHHAWVEIKT